MERPASRRRNRSQRQLSPSGSNSPHERDTPNNDEGVPLQEKTQEHSTRLISRASIFLLICCTSTLVVFLNLWHIWGPDLHVSNNEGLNQSSTAPSSNWELHPEDHALRPPATIRLSWNITSEYRRPDGVKKLTYLINGAFPGPTIEARSGDRLIVDVTNGLDDDGLVMHWHGLHMRDANHMDGVPGVTQCPIIPGSSMVYDFTISGTQSGTFWYHAHSSLQRADGLYGGLVIHKPSAPAIRGIRNRGAYTDGMKYRYGKEHLLLIGDWYHRPANQILSWYHSPASNGNEPVPDSLLVNGEGEFNCSMAVPRRPVDCIETGYPTPQFFLDSGISHRIRVINTGSVAGFTLIFQHGTVDLLQVDGGTDVQRSSAKSKAHSVGILYPGQRMDLIVRNAAGKSGRSSLTVELDPECFNFPNPALTDTQTFPILDPSKLRSPNQISSLSSNPLPNNAIGKGNKHIDLADATSTKTEISQIPLEADQTFVVYTVVTRLARNGNSAYGFFNHTSWHPQTDPPLPLITLDRSKWDANQFSISTGNKPAWIDLIVNNLDEGPHPFHLHGHDFYVLSVFESDIGWGSYNHWEPQFNPSSAPPYDFSKAIRRDTVQIPPRGHVVLRFRADNPGIWMFHCHILWHLASGMAMIMDVMDDTRYMGGNGGVGEVPGMMESCRYLS